MSLPKKSLLNKVQKNIFLKKKNNKYKLIPFFLESNSIGETRYSPPASKEWKNSVYFYNSNNMKNLPVYDINVYTLIKSYFNLYFNKKVLKYKILKGHNYLIKNILMKKLLKSSFFSIRRLSYNKIFVSKPEIKHTNSNAIITIYTYNRERKSLLKKIKLLKRMFSAQRHVLNDTRTITWLFSLKENLYEKKLKLGFSKKYRTLKSNFSLSKLNFFFNGKKSWSYILTPEHEYGIKYKNLMKLVFYKEFLLIRRLKFKLHLNSMKFQENLLSTLSYFISKYYKKKVEFNIINLKSIILNSDIFTEILTLKVKKEKVSAVNFMNMILKRAVIPSIQKKPASLGRKTVDWELFENKLKISNLNFIIKPKPEGIDQIINEFNYNIIDSKEVLDRDYSKVKDIIFNSIKYKNIGGIRLEIKGRITRRYRADRALVKRKWKGEFEIKDRYKWTSSVMYRGYTQPNIQHTMFTSKRRIGAFAVKGWISGR